MGKAPVASLAPKVREERTHVDVISERRRNVSANAAGLEKSPTRQGKAPCSKSPRREDTFRSSKIRLELAKVCNSRRNIAVGMRPKCAVVSWWKWPKYFATLVANRAGSCQSVQLSAKMKVEAAKVHNRRRLRSEIWCRNQPGGHRLWYKAGFWELPVTFRTGTL